jgi:hypothetical protein
MKRQRIKYFSPEEKRKLLDFLQQNCPNKPARRSEFMYKLMFSTGLRLAESYPKTIPVADLGFRLDLRSENVAEISLIQIYKERPHLIVKGILGIKIPTREDDNA